MKPKPRARRRTWKKILIGTITAPCLAILALLVAVQVRWDRTFEAPLPAIAASTDSSVIERGRYLVYGPAHCAYCHNSADKWAALEAGEEISLAGGYTFELPFGSIHTPNLTPDPETGIGRRTDGELARMLRHGVRADGRAAVPFMSFANLSDEDLTAVISFLRSQEPVRSEVPGHELNVIGKGLMSFVIAPTGPSGTPPASSPPEAPTVERGRYLANSVANCTGCHTNRSPLDGSAIGPEFAGGSVMPDETDPAKVFVTPNLTPDPKTGRITSWTEDQFVARFRAGRVYEGSHMPWAAFARMSDADLRAIYRYLRSLPPVENETGPSRQDARR